MIIIIVFLKPQVGVSHQRKDYPNGNKMVADPNIKCRLVSNHSKNTLNVCFIPHPQVKLALLTYLLRLYTCVFPLG